MMIFKETKRHHKGAFHLGSLIKGLYSFNFDLDLFLFGFFRFW